MSSGSVIITATVNITQGEDVTTRVIRKDYGGNLFASIPQPLEVVAEDTAKIAARDAVAAAKAIRP